MLNSSFLRPLLGSAGLRVLNAGLGFALAIVLARMLGAEGYGIYTTAFVMASVCAIVVQFGLPNVVMRETAASGVSEDWRRMAAVWAWATRTALILSASVVLLGSLALVTFWGGGSGENSWTYLLALALVPLTALASLRTGALRGLQHTVLAQIPEIIVKPVVMLTLAFTVGFVMPVSPSLAMAMQIIAVSSAFLVGAAFLYKLRPRQLQRHRYRALRPGSGLWKATATMAFAAGMNQINNYADLLILGIFRSPEEVGVYRIAFQIALVCAFGLQISSLVVSPYFARLYKEKKPEELQNLVANAALLSTIVALMLALPWFIFGDFLIVLFFGAEFSDSIRIAQVLIAAQVLNASFGPVGMLMNMTGMERYVARFMAFAAVLNIILNLTWVPNYGALGAATATFVTFGVWNLGLFWAAKSQLGLHSHVIGIVYK